MDVSGRERKYLSEKREAHVNQLRMLAERLKITLGKKTTGNVGLRWEECSPGALRAFLGGLCHVLLWECWEQSSQETLLPTQGE